MFTTSSRLLSMGLEVDILSPASGRYAVIRHKLIASEQGGNTAKISDPMMNFTVKGSSGTPPFSAK